MKRSLRVTAAAASAAALMAVTAPAAQAGPEDAAGCTTVYVDTLTRSSTPPLVTYTPPAGVAVNGNSLIAYATWVEGVTWAYVDCLR